MDKLQCEVERITFRNDDDGYSVLKCSSDDFSNIITVVGYMPDVEIGETFNFYGRWGNHPKYGKQFIFEKYEELLPTTLDGIKKYLGGGRIKGIRESYAEKIVDHFGEKTLEILDNDPDRLSEIHGIGVKKLAMIKESWNANREINRIMVALQSYDVTTNLATKIYNYYGPDSISVVSSNPYKLADDIWGVGFKKADQIALKMGFKLENYERIRSGILYTLNKYSTDEGHCFAIRSDLVKDASELLGVNSSFVEDALEKMVKQRDLIRERLAGEDENQSGSAYYLPMYYYSEVGTANRLLRLLDTERNGYFEGIRINEWIMTDEKPIHYDTIQLQAIQAAIDNKVLVLTGGPGTGKTTTTKGIINAYREIGAKILLAAPTGRAAKRMSEVTGMKAKTIHRLLEAVPPAGFNKNEDNPLKGDVLIVDECSMIDILLMNSLLKAIPPNMTLILVGDVDQLPSVGPGKVLADVLSSGAVPYIKLNRIFRQAQSSLIVRNAHKINNGGYLELPDNNSDFIFLDNDDAEKAALQIVELCSKILPRDNTISPDDIQVLTPMRRGPIGTETLNKMLQNALNPEGLALKHGFTEYRVNDKVMQIRNNYEKGVFNGDIGFITAIDKETLDVTVEFDDEKFVKYNSIDLDEIVLAYATTIHKSQGSEFSYVVMPIMMSHFIMLQRNLLYTGVTRAKKGLIIIGEKRALFYAVKNNKIVQRNTMLAARLQKDSTNLFSKTSSQSEFSHLS
ncbi:MAG: ATP-dependent RecD-like DNA helicase [Synergistaceae bacterium]|nr:ATP-dependent RecD-like DNA helicase [Synergistaceae bacterium]